VGLKTTALQRCGAFQNPALQRCALQRSAAARSGTAAHSAALQCVPIPATTHFLWDHFDGKIPANNILYNISWAPTDERRARIIIPAEKKNHGGSKD
jgi:hypothetical protein